MEETWKEALEIFEEDIWRHWKEKCRDVVRRHVEKLGKTRGDIGRIHVETLEGDTRIHESVDRRQIGGKMDWRSMEA